MGRASASVLLRRLHKAFKRLDKDQTNDTALLPLTRQLRKSRLGVAGASSGMDALHLNVHNPNKLQQEVVYAEFWNGFQEKRLSMTKSTSETSGVLISAHWSYLAARVGEPSFDRDIDAAFIQS